MLETFAYIKLLLTEIFVDHMSIKAVGSVVFAIASFLFSGLSHQALEALMLLIVIDFVTGIWSSKQSGELITAKKAFITPRKILVYFTMIACGHMVEYGIPNQVSFVDDTMLTFLLITEFLSIMKHFSELGYKTPSKLINNMRLLQQDK